MEAAAGVIAAGRGISLPINSSQTSRKEWRVVSEQSVRNSSNEELERSKLGQSDERLIYEQGREPADVDFCSVTIDGNSDNDILQQRLHSVVKQKEELQQMEIDIRAQLIARGEITEMRNTYDAQIKDHANANIKLQEQLREKEQRVLELERRIEEKDRELHAIRLDNEAVWAKEDLLREQSKELQTYRRERDSTEAERAQHIKQIHDLQEHIQEKERQFMELQEKNRNAQENIIYKDEQLREAQSWISRVQEMDALQSNTNHTLQAELRERTEQYNQLWLACQRQFGEMERLHLHIQQLQLELAETRERSGTFSDGPHTHQTNQKDASQIGQSNSNHLDMSGSGGTPGGSTGSLPNGNVDNASFVSVGNVQNDHIHGLPFGPSPLLGMPTYIPPAQVSALHPFMLHQQGVPHSVASHVQQSHVGHFHSMTTTSSLQHWHNSQVVSEGAQMPTQDQHSSLQTDPALLRRDTNYDFESSVNGQVIHPDYINANISQGVEAHSVVQSSNVDGQDIDLIEKGYSIDAKSQQSLQQISAQFHDALRLNSNEHSNDSKEKNVNSFEPQGLIVERPVSTSNIPSSEEANHSGSLSESTINSASDVVSSESLASASQKNTVAAGKSLETPLLDERSLLACIVRTIPPGGRIRISSTLPNRLGKMIAPLHWHDYKKKYGKLDEFVSSHPELFVIEGDYIQLREGAQEIIAATSAVAKVAAAAAATSFSSVLPSVAVTPMAQSHRLKKAPSESSSGKSDSSMFKEYVTSRPPNVVENSAQLSLVQNSPSNGASFNVPGGVQSIKILKSKDHVEMNGSEIRPVQPVQLAVGNGTNSDRNDFGSSQQKGSNHWRASASVVGKQQGRIIGAATSSRR